MTVKVYENSYTWLCAHRLFHQKASDIIITLASRKALMEGKRPEAEDICKWISSVVKGKEINCLDSESEKKLLVFWEYNDLLNLLFKAAVLPHERKWDKAATVWIVNRNALTGIEKMCEAFGIKFNFTKSTQTQE